MKMKMRKNINVIQKVLYFILECISWPLKIKTNAANPLKNNSNNKADGDILFEAAFEKNNVQPTVERKVKRKFSKKCKKTAIGNANKGNVKITPSLSTEKEIESPKTDKIYCYCKSKAAFEKFKEKLSDDELAQHLELRKIKFKRFTRRSSSVQPDTQDDKPSKKTVKYLKRITNSFTFLIIFIIFHICTPLFLTVYFLRKFDII